MSLHAIKSGPAEAWLALRFLVAGLSNTLLGGAIIALAQAGLGFSPPLANAAGFAVGWVLGFVLNRGFVFRHSGPRHQAMQRYAISVALAFAANQAVLAALSRCLESAPFGPALAQLGAMATYTVASFALFRFWAFRGSING